MMTNPLRKFSFRTIPIILILILPAGFFLLLLDESDEYKRVKAERGEYLEILLDNIDAGFYPFFQLVSTAAALSGELELSEDAHEEFLNDIFASSRSELVYGMGIWYEPGGFDPERRWYGPYIRFDVPEGRTSSLTYEWNTPEYDYQQTYWYQLLLKSDGKDVVVSIPYFDMDYTYITIGMPFFRDGVKTGVITVDVIFPLLEEFFSRFDFSDFEGLYLTNWEDSVIFTMKGQGLRESQNKRAIHEYEISSSESMFKLYGFVERKNIILELVEIHSFRYGILIIIWLIILTFYLVNSVLVKHKKQNMELNSENLQLKYEIRKREEAESQLQFLAYHDPVTGLSNLNSFFENVSPPSYGDDKRFLILISLSNIRELSFILEKGLVDSLLKDFAGKLTDLCPESSMQFRGRGFSFYIVNEDAKAGDSALLAEELLREFSRTIPMHKRNVKLKIRLGIAPFESAQNLEHLTKMSQSTLSDDSRRDINKVSHYNSELESRKSFLIALDSEMSGHGFIDELRMVYQPIVRVNDRKIAGLEILVRWDSQFFKTTVSPAEFIPVAEENGYIIDIGWFALSEALKALSGVLSDKDWFVSVNVSPIQFIESDFIAKLERLVSESGVDKKRLKLEITESAAAANIQFFWQTIDILIKKGFRLAIDDFGTGESSFSRLYSYPFDTLKIDRSLISDIIENRRNQRIFKSILQLGSVMDNNVIAEGIEEEEEHELLKSFGLKYAQGYLYSKPVNLSELF